MPRPITEDVVTVQAARLGDDGWSYTPRQLYYAVCGAVETAPMSTAQGEFGCGVLLMLLGAIALQFNRAGALVLLMLGVVAFFSGVRSRQRDRLRATLATSPGLAVSYLEFDERWVAPHRLKRTDPIPGMLIDTEPVQVAISSGPDWSGDIVVCDRRETAALLQANAGRAGIAIPIADESAVPEDARPARVFAVHDADPGGCALPLRLVQRTGVVIDIGLRPAQLAGQHAPVIEGAPVVVPSTLTTVVDQADYEWLVSGRRCELAVLPPAALSGLVTAALNAGPVSVGDEVAPSSIVRAPVEVRIPAVSPDVRRALRPA